MKPSGKFVLRVEPELHLQLKEQAKAMHQSLNHWIVQRLKADLGSVGGAESELVCTVKDAFANQLEALIQFGSSVRGERRETSDIDLLVVLKSERPIDRSLYHEWDRVLANVVGQVYSPQFAHPPDLNRISSLWLEVAVEGRILYDPTGLVEDRLRRVRERIAAGFFVRKLSHGHPYWVRKDAK